VDGRPAKPAYSLRGGEMVSYDAPPVAEPPVDTDAPALYEDERVFAVNKPGNLPCHPAGAYAEHTLWYLWKDRLDVFRLINRLDRETSGIVLLARDGEAARLLSAAFARGQVDKQYLVVVEGDFPETLDATGNLSLDPDSTVRKKRRFVPGLPEADGEFAETHFTRLATIDGLTLVRVRPRTGRLHQIRATLCSLGHPVVGDKLYGVDDTLYLRFIDDTLTAADRAALRLPRQALHAWRLTIPHPDGSGPLHLESPLPPDIAGLRPWPALPTEG
jgi:23S rRNA pseudouridine955/2504/2580 synthase/23S rRNA pseudouridine1911/1915/1917 synthase